MQKIPAVDGFRGLLRNDAAVLEGYSEAGGIGEIVPRAVAVPGDADDVAALVKWAVEHRMPLVPRGSGSSMAGGAIGDGMIVDLSRLRTLGVVNLTTRTIRCGPGVLRDEVDAAARPVGLCFPVDPSSGAFCTIGGMAATNAAGAHTMRYGSTRRWVEALDCVFADGSRAEIRRGAPVPDVAGVRRFMGVAPALVEAERASPSRHHVRKESSGYALADFADSGELVDLLVGSEGTLAIIVGLELRLAPVLPFTASILGAFASLEDAVAGASEARAADASCCELLDRTFLDVARRGGVSVPVAGDTEAVLLAEVEGISRDECEAAARDLASQFTPPSAVSLPFPSIPPQTARCRPSALHP